MFLERELWAKVVGFPSYEISNKGRLKSTYRKIMKPSKDRDGYLHTSLKKKNVFIHRLVLEAFVSPCPKGMICRHLDGNPTNNNVSNLKWGTYKENHEDRVKHGRNIWLRGQRSQKNHRREPRCQP